MSRAIWKGHISFGLVQIPVELQAATRDQDLDFDMLDKRDMAHIGYRRINKRTGEEVPNDQIVKGYEYEAGRYVIVEEADFAKANAEATRTVEIVAFVDGDALDPRYFVRPYYVVPTQKKPKAYALLREVLQRSGKVGIARVVLRSRQYLGALIVREGVLVLELLRYAPEVLTAAGFEAPGDLAALGVTDKEVALAELLVKGLEDTWDPKAYKDEYRDDLLALIEEKAERGDVKTVSEPADDETDDGGTVVDIMELLKRSVAGGAKKPVGSRKKPDRERRALERVLADPDLLPHAAWKNHGAYVSCVSRATTALVNAGHMTSTERAAALTAAAR